MADKLPIVNYSGKQKEIASGDKIPFAYLRANVNTITSIAAGDFADPNNPTTAEVDTFIAGLTADEQLESLIVYDRSFTLKPAIYNYPTTITSLTVSGSDVANLDSIDINGNNYVVNLPLEQTSGVPLEETGLLALINSIEGHFTTEGLDVKAFVYYSWSGTSLANARIALRQTSGSTAFTIVYNYTNNAGSVSTTLATNTPSLTSAAVTTTSDDQNPFAAWYCMNGTAYEVHRKQIISGEYGEVNDLPTHNILDHPVGLVFKETSTNRIYQSSTSGWVLVSDPFTLLNFNLSSSTSYLGTDADKVYIKVDFEEIPTLTNFFGYLIIRASRTILTNNFDKLQAFAEIDGELVAIDDNHFWCFHKTNGTTYDEYRYNLAYTGNPPPIYLYVDGFTGGTGTGGFSYNIYLKNNTLTTNYISGQTEEVTYSIADLTLEKTTDVVRNVQPPRYTTTERDSVTLTDTAADWGKLIYNTTVDRLEYWNGTEWVAADGSGAADCFSYQFQTADTNVSSTAGYAHITSFSVDGTLKVNQVDDSAQDLSAFWSNLGVGSILMIYTPDVGDFIRFAVTSITDSGTYYTIATDYISGYTSAPTTPQTMKLCVPVYVPNGSGYVTSVGGTSPIVSSGGTTPAISLSLNSTTMENSGGLNAKNTTALWNANKIQGQDVLNDTPADGDVIKWVAANGRFEFLPDNTGAGAAFDGTIVTSGGGTTTLTSSSEYELIIDGSSNETIQLPDATTLSNWRRFLITNNSTSLDPNAISVTYDDTTSFFGINNEEAALVVLLDNSTTNGVWDYTILQGRRDIFDVLQITASGGTTTLIATSKYETYVVGATSQDVVLPDATTLNVGRRFLVSNDSTGNVRVLDDGTNVLVTLQEGERVFITLINNSSSTGTWELTHIKKTDLTFSGASSPYTLSSSTGSDVTFKQGTNITINRVGNELEFVAAGGSTDLTFTGASSPYTLNSSTGTDVTFAQGTNVTISRSSNELTIAAAGADLAFSGASSPVTLTSSTGTDVTITAGANITLSATGSDIIVSAAAPLGLGLMNAMRLGIIM